jgi:signal transduction histidine kinase
VPVEVHAPSERLEHGVEAAAYFIGCEGLTNAVKHAGASRIVLSAERRDEKLVVSVVDDGSGDVEPSRGSGSTVSPPGSPRWAGPCGSTAAQGAQY